MANVVLPVEEWEKIKNSPERIGSGGDIVEEYPDTYTSPLHSLSNEPEDPFTNAEAWKKWANELPSRFHAD